MAAGDTGLGGFRQPVMLQSVDSTSVRRMRDHYEAGESKEAERLCRAILETDSGQFDALQVLGVLYLSAGQPEEAERLFRRSLLTNDRESWAFANHGTALAKLGRFDEALRPFEDALRLDARYAPALTGRANALLEQGRYGDAVIAYEKVLAVVPKQASSWTNLGKALLMSGRPGEALVSIDRSLQIDPRSFTTHVNRGYVLRALGRFAEALESFSVALTSQPESTSLLVMQARTFQDLGQVADALGVYEAALRIKPGDIEALCGRSVALERLLRFEEALNACEAILALKPTETRAWLGKGNALQGLLRHGEAVRAYDEALRLAPGFADAWSNRTVALLHQRLYPEALHSCDRALEAGGDRADVLSARGNILQRLGRYSEASQSYWAAIAVEPDSVPAWFHRATTLQHLGRYREALAGYEHVIAMAPTQGAARAAESFCRLLLGDFEQGWINHESRWTGDPAVARFNRTFSQPLWLGEQPIQGRTLLLYSEQGLGDTLQFCRYASRLHEYGARVVLDVQPSLKTLMATLKGTDAVIATGEAAPPFDMQCPLMSLPLAFRKGGLAEPAPTPYLASNSERVDVWERRLSDATKPGRRRVGLAWSGNPVHTNDHNRTIAFEAMTDLFGTDVEFVSLQPVIRSEDAAAVRGTRLVYFGESIRDFADTAAIIELLDLVISVDTSVAHLAGAMGKPVWILLPFSPDWRWLLDREDSPWYPSARLFRQPELGGWASVVRQVASALVSWNSDQAPADGMAR